MSEFQFTNPQNHNGRAPEPNYKSRPLGFRGLTDEEWQFVRDNALTMSPSIISRKLNHKIDPEWIEVKVNEITGDRAVWPKRYLKDFFYEK